MGERGDDDYRASHYACIELSYWSYCARLVVEWLLRALFLDQLLPLTNYRGDRKTAVFHPNFAQTTLTAPCERVILPAVVCRGFRVPQAKCVTKQV